MIDRLTISPPSEESISPKIKYTKKARHGHDNDVTDIHNIRQVAGCLPIDPYAKRFLLISSSKNPEQWVIPKGGWENNETREHAALRETWEEAGLKGNITHQLGVFVERSNKKIKAHHWIFEMQIEEVCKKYPERMKRDRRWFTYEEALVATGNNEYLKEAIRLSSISPKASRAKLTPRYSIDGTIPSLHIDTKFTSKAVKPQSPIDTEILSPSSFNSRKSKDAFQALQELMKNAPVS